MEHLRNTADFSDYSLRDFFRDNSRIAIAFSGGVDSSYLLFAAAKSGADVTAYYGKGPFQPEFEYEDAKRIAEFAGAEMRVLDVDILRDRNVKANPPDRCYYCKRVMMGAVCRAAAEDGYEIVCDGTNASDDLDDRPGARALRELGIRSPLRECGLTKEKIRELSRDAGLFTWNKPSYACLATRSEVGHEITAEQLERTETAETYMMNLGFKDFRVRTVGEAAKIEVTSDQIGLLMDHRSEIIGQLSSMYSGVYMDLETRDEK